ncbi:FHA domain-containing protein [Bordetella sp. BOR01]|uniref:FHA domain-containing protein n=1 Tax=Bordetella sp. BOR01 TaxID=2854779 RepID=UPI0021059735|nr:FHA domain-containing protein [Bordetella sp. BOR01]
MRLTVLPHRDNPGLPPLSAVFQAPGGTLGRSADNHLALPDSERGICRVQAALRISDGACYLVNLSSMSHVSINGRTITRDQEVPLAPGDELAIGPYTLKAEDPAAPQQSAAAAGVAGVAGAAALQAGPAEPDPLLDGPLLEGVDLTPPDTQTIHQASSSSVPAAPVPSTGALAAPASAATAPGANEPPAASPAELPPVDIPATHLPAADLPPVALQPEAQQAPQAPDAPPPSHPFQPAQASPDLPFDDLDPPLAAEPQSAQAEQVDVFSDLFGPGTLPVGSVPDVSAHPFDLESAQGRNPEDPLRHLPPGDANLRGPARDPLDMLGSPDTDDAHSVFSDQTPSTLPSHDPLAPHRSDPVTDTLNPREREEDARAARDHLREYGGYLRPARVKPQATSDNDSGKPPRK